jgi:hypothetical protein
VAPSWASTLAGRPAASPPGEQPQDVFKDHPQCGSAI